MIESPPQPQSRWSRLGELAGRPVDGAWLAAFRFLFGIVMCVSMLRFLYYGWIDEFFVRPAFHFKYWGFSWVEVLSAGQMHALFWILSGLALAIAFGFCFRVAAFLFFVGFGYVQLIDVATYLNHYYLALLLALLLTVSPAGKRYSLDAWIGGRLFGRTHHGDSVALGWLYLFRFQVGAVYTFAGFAKAHTDWLFHAQPLRIWLGARTDMPLLGPLFSYDAAPLFMSWAGFLFDGTIVLWLALRKTRVLAYGAVIMFHVLTRLLFPIGMFPVIMIVSALLFFSPEWPRNLWHSVLQAARLMGARTSLARRSRESHQFNLSSPAGSRARWVSVGLALGIAWCCLQLAVPLRFLVYGGNVRWHEQGMRFSWRVMVREKNGSITYVVRSKRTGRVWELNPKRYLTRVQERELSTQPDLILQLARHIAKDFERRGEGPVEVRVDALVSLNGRHFSRLIDPQIDLSRVTDGVANKTWILPAPSAAPPHLRAI